MSEKRIKILIFLFFTFFYLVFLGDYSKEAFYSSDEVFYFRLTQSLTDHRSLEIESYLGHSHSKYLPGQSLAGIPFYVCARLLVSIFPGMVNPTLFMLILVHLTNVIIGAILCVVFYQFGRDLGYGQESSLGGAICLGLFTPFFTYSKQYFADPLAALFILLFVRFTFLGFRKDFRKAIWAGVFFGAACFTKIDNGLLLIGVLAIFLFEKRSRIQRILHFAAGFIPFVILILVYNHFNYGNAFKPGYERQAFASPFWSGLFGLLFSPSRGLFLFSPPVILFFLGAGKFRKKFPRIFLLCLVLGIARIAILAKWFSWQGGWSWGSRLLLPVIPLLFLPALEIFESWNRKKSYVKISVLGLLLLGFWIQIIGVLVSPNKFNNDIWGMMTGEMSQFLFIPQLSTIRGNLFLITQGKLDLLWIKFLRGGDFVASLGFVLNLGAALFLGGILLQKLGFGKKGWLQKFLPEWKAVFSCAFIIILISGISHVIMRSQGIRGLRYTYIENPRIPGSQPITQTFRGYLFTPIEGEYQFSLKIRGTHEILLDGKAVLQGAEDLPQHWDFTRVHLKTGYHAIVIRYTPRRDSDISLMHLYWTIPDCAEYKSIIGPRYLFKKPPGGIRRLLLLFVLFRSWIILLVILFFLLRYWYRTDPCSE